MSSGKLLKEAAGPWTCAEEMLDIILEKGSGRRTRASGQAHFIPSSPQKGAIHATLPRPQCQPIACLAPEGMMLHYRKHKTGALSTWNPANILLGGGRSLECGLISLPRCLREPRCLASVESERAIPKARSSFSRSMGNPNRAPRQERG